MTNKLPMLGGIMGKTIANSSNEVIDQQQYIVVAKAGNDSNSGFNDQKPYLTLDAAIDGASALTPSASNPVLIKLLDGGIYDLGATNKTLPSYCNIFGPGATLTATTGSLVLSDDSRIVIGDVQKTGSGYIFNKTSGSGRATVEILGTGSVANGFLNIANGSVLLNFKDIYAGGASNPISIQVIGGSLYFNGRYLNNSNGSGKAIAVSGSAKVYGMLEEAFATNTWLDLADTCTCYIKVNKTSGGFNTAGTPTYHIDSGFTTVSSGDINIQSAGGDVNLTGTNINSSGYSLNSGQPFFQAYLTASAANETGDGTAYTVLYNGFTVNRGSVYNTSTGIFTAPKDGVYMLTASARLYASTSWSSSHNRAYIRLLNSNENWLGQEQDPYKTIQLQGTDTVIITVSRLVYMDQGDTSQVDVVVAGATKVIGVFGGQDYSSFSGGLIC